MWFLLFRLFLSTLISGPSDLRGTRGQNRRAIALPHPSDFFRHRSKTLPSKAFDYKFILSLIYRSSNGPDQLTPTLLTYLYSNTFFMGEFSIFFFHPPLQNFRLSANNGFSNKKNKQCIDTSSEATKINFLVVGNLFYHFYFLFIFKHIKLVIGNLILLWITICPRCLNVVGSTDKRTDGWWDIFMIWKIDFGLWAVAWAGLWNKRFGPIMSNF